MVQKKVISQLESWGCPVCSYQAYSLRGVAQHLAMKRDKIHETWRVEHKFPEGYITMPEVIRITWKIREILRTRMER